MSKLIRQNLRPHRSAFLLGTLLLLTALALGIWFPRDNVSGGEGCTRTTIWLTLFWYAITLSLLLLKGFSPMARWCWTWGCVVYLIHVGFAFHVFHHWSHHEAFLHVESESGFGAGIFVSYFFTLLWVVDVIWWWFNEKSYLARPAWMTWSLHGFLFFIVFNATVIFETGWIRWLSVAWLLAMAMTILTTRSGERGQLCPRLESQRSRSCKPGP